MTEGRYDVLVIGGGPAGLTAGMYAARQNLRTAIVAGEIGGQAAWATEIENYMGFQLVSGPELIRRFRRHVSAWDVECLEGRLVNGLTVGKEGFEVFTREGEILRARSLILATGRSHNRLAVPGERELVGRGVSYCATCDASFFRGRPVAVVGPGEAAVEAALELTDLDATVTLLSERALKADAVLLERLRERESAQVREGTRVVAIEGEDRVSGVRVRDLETKAEETLSVEGVFIETGSIPAGEFTGGMVETNERGEILVDERNATSVPGIYAAGDVTSSFGKQVIIAAGEGARAAMAAGRDLKRG